MKERHDPGPFPVEQLDRDHHPIAYEVMTQLHGRLPDIASALIDTTDPENRSFALEPDSPLEHSPRWHQYGILTHSRKFAEALQSTVPAYLEQWDLREPAEDVLAVPIDGIPKGQLLEIAGLVHDIGKFTARRVTYDAETGARSVNFREHEAHSGRVIREELHPLLAHWGLGDSHIEYIAACAELHFELAKVRRASRDTGGYTMDFPDSSAFDAAVKEILDTYPDYALEIGLQFIADSSSKTEVAATSETDAGIALERPALEAEIFAKGINPQLIGLALQQPVNMRVAEKYLRYWAAQGSFQG